MTTNVLFFIIGDWIKSFAYAVTFVLPLQFILYITTIFSSMDWAVTAEVCSVIACINVCFKLYCIEIELDEIDE